MLNRKIKQAFTAGITVMLVGAQALSVSADTADDIAYVKNQKAANASAYNQLAASISDLEDQKNEITAQISDYEGKLVVAIATINSLNDQLTEKEAELEQTSQDLDAAEQKKATEYSSMKQRIQYLYENGGDAAWGVALLEDDDLSTFLTKAEYTQKMYKYDRDCLEEYAETVSTVQDLQAQQTEEKSNLETMKNEQVEYEDYLEQLKAEAQEKSDNYDAEIANAEEKAAQYQALIEQQNAQIQQLEAKKAQEDAAKAAAEQAAREEAARRQAQQEEQARAAAAQQAQVAQQAQTAQQTQNTQETASQTQAAADGQTTAAETSQTDTSAETQTTASSNSGLGSSIAAYACQFVGNPYVYGGNSLTNGIDCSGFVQQIMAHFGIRVSRTSYSQACDGVGVSYGDMQPGDVICYGSHVAIYIGNNQIVHASNPTDGIKISSNPAYRPIVAIRRMY